MSKFFDRRIRWVCALAVAASILPNPAALAGTIRHDRSDQLYRSAARTPALAAVVQTEHAWPELGITGGCSGTLISPEWVLLASHCFWDPVRGPSSFAAVEVGGNQILIGPDNIFINTEWLSSFSARTAIGDIALIRLPRPITQIKPIAPNTSLQEVGNWGYIAGFGRTGTGKSGSIGPGGVKRAGINFIDATEANVVFPSRFQQGRVSVGSSKALLVDFDNSRRDSSTLGDSDPLNMEYSAAPGDSGGPLLLYNNGTFTVAGVVSGGVFGNPMPNASAPQAFYGVIGTYARVAAYRQWIQSVMSGNERSLSQLLQARTPADALAAQQRFAVQQIANARNGISVHAYSLAYEVTPPKHFAERLASTPHGSILTLAVDAAANIRQMADQADQEALQFVHLDCASCGGEVAEE